MKKIPMIMMILVAASLQVSALAEDNNLPAPSLVSMVPNETFIPSGFDSNDRAQAVIAGFYPDSCYKSGPTTVRVDQEKKKVYVNHQAYLFKGCWCLQVLIPYNEAIDFGILSPGQYEVVAIDRNGKEVKLGGFPVAQAKTTSPDDFLYASVEEAYLDLNTPEEPSLVLRGSLPSSCAVLSEVKVNYREPNVIEVLPILKMDEAAKCQDVMAPFETRVDLQPSWAGRTLIHIRSLNGRAVNRVVEFR